MRLIIRLTKVAHLYNLNIGMQDLPVLDNSEETSAQKEDVSVVSRSNRNFLLIPVFFIGVIIIFILVFLKFGVFSGDKVVTQVGDKQITESDLTEQEERLLGYYKGSLSQEQIKKISDGRKAVALYASQNGISVSDADVQAKKDELFKAIGRDMVMKDIAVYGWDEEGWVEVLWWQILREKILASFDAYRVGEYISARWDSYSPVLDEANANIKSPAAKKYLESIRAKVVTGEVKLSDVYKNFDVKVEPGFASDQKYYLQYRGVNAEGEYFKFKITPQAAGAQVLSKLKFKEVSEVSCDLAACYFYNIVSGSDGVTENESVKSFLNGDYLI